MKRIEVRQEQHPVGVWAAFPGFSPRAKDGDYVVDRKDGRELYRLPTAEIRA